MVGRNVCWKSAGCRCTHTRRVTRFVDDMQIANFTIFYLLLLISRTFDDVKISWAELSAKRVLCGWREKFCAGNERTKQRRLEKFFFFIFFHAHELKVLCTAHDALVTQSSGKKSPPRHSQPVSDGEGQSQKWSREINGFSRSVLRISRVSLLSLDFFKSFWELCHRDVALRRWKITRWHGSCSIPIHGIEINPSQSIQQHSLSTVNPQDKSYFCGTMNYGRSAPHNFHVFLSRSIHRLTPTPNCWVVRNANMLITRNSRSLLPADTHATHTTRIVLSIAMLHTEFVLIHYFSFVVFEYMFFFVFFEGDYKIQTRNHNMMLIFIIIFHDYNYNKHYLWVAN